MMTLNQGHDRFAVKHEPLGSYRVTPLSGVWATGIEYECLLAQGAAEAIYQHIKAEREFVDLRDDLTPKLPCIESEDDEHGYTTEGYYKPQWPGC
jgi:hypothetical protein